MRDRRETLPRSRLGLLIAFAVVWLALLPAVARASPVYSEIKLDMRTEGADVPTHLCVVAEAKGPLARQKLFELLERGDKDRLLVDPKVWDGDMASRERQRCGKDPITDCRPQLELPSKLADTGELYVACTADLSAEGASVVEPRPLFVLIEYLNASPPQIESVRLGGGVATVGVYGASLKGVDLTARTLGGSYTPDTRANRGVIESDARAGEATVKLELSPRCRQIEVKLPHFKVASTDRKYMNVRVHGKRIDVDTCVDNLVGSNVIQVRVPPAPLGVGSIDVEIAGNGRTARFGQDYEQRWPDTPFVLEFKQVSFTWRRPQCIYPADECPIARLEGGTTCAGEVIAPEGPGRRSPGCRYRCPGEYSDETAIDISLPADVEFEKSSPTQTWTDTLSRNGEELTSYVGSDEVYLSGSIHDWRTDVPDNGISAVQIYGEDGTIKKSSVAHVDRLVIKVPSAAIQAPDGTCEGVRFKPVGDRAYDELVASVSDGKMDFGNPERGARPLNFTVTIAAGGGPAWVPGIRTPPLYFTGLGMFGIEVRPRRGPWASRFAGEFRVGMTLGTWGVTREEQLPAESTPPTRDPPGEEEEMAATEEQVQEQRIGWARVLFEPGMSMSLHERVALGVGLGLGFSLPFRRGDAELTRSDINFIYSPVLDFRFRLRHWVRLVFQFRYMGGEKGFQISEDNRDPEATETRRDEDRAESFIFLAGLQFKF